MCQITFDEIPGPQTTTAAHQEEGKDLSSGQLGCCSKIRDCSRAGHCLQDDEYYKQCGYRKNLEKGNVFYSEKANSFSQERYDYIESFRNSLDENEKGAFDEIVIYFEKTKRGTKSCFCLNNDNIRSVIEKCNAFELKSGGDLTARVFDAGLILISKAADLHKKYSNLPAPELLEKPPVLSSTASKAEKDERQSKADMVNRENLKRWQNHYAGDNDLINVLSSAFLLFGITDYSLELNEYFLNNIQSFQTSTSNLEPFDPKKPNKFKEKLL